MKIFLISSLVFSWITLALSCIYYKKLFLFIYKILNKNNVRSYNIDNKERTEVEFAAKQNVWEEIKKQAEDDILTVPFEVKFKK